MRKCQARDNDVESKNRDFYPNCFNLLFTKTIVIFPITVVGQKI